MPTNNLLDRVCGTQREPKAEREAVHPDASKIMYDALVRIAHSDAFFDSEKRLVRIAREAIEKATGVKR